MGTGRKVHRAAAAGFLVVLTAAACATSGGSSDSTTAATPSPTPSPSDGGPPPPVADLTLAPGAVGQGVPGDEVPDPEQAGPGVAWTAEDGLLYVVTFGSSTCPQLAEPDATLGDDGTLSVTLVAPSDGPCTMDYVPTTTVVGVPDGVDEAVAHPVDLGEGKTATLEPRAEAGAVGPVGWAAGG